MPTRFERLRQRTQRCAQCRASLPPSPEHFRRLNDPSDPVPSYAARCLSCEARGDMTLVYDRITAQMEVAHGPLCSWSRATHRAHTRAIYEAAGMTEMAQQYDRILHEGAGLVDLPLDPGSPLFRPPAMAHATP